MLLFFGVFFFFSLGKVNGICHLFVGQGQLEHLFDILHIVESQSVQIDRLYLLNILAVLFTQDDILDTSPFGGQDLFLDTSDRKNFSAKGYFAGHGQIGFDLALGECRRQ